MITLFLVERLLLIQEIVLVKMANNTDNQRMKTCSSRVKAQSPGDEIVISGISGKFPNSKNLAEFSHNLYNKVSFIISIASHRKKIS